MRLFFFFLKQAAILVTQKFPFLVVSVVVHLKSELTSEFAGLAASDIRQSQTWQGKVLLVVPSSCCGAWLVCPAPARR